MSLTMENIFFRLQSYLRYLNGSNNQYRIHSPFVYLFITKCLYHRKKHPAYSSVKQELKKLKKQTENPLARTSFTAKRLRILNRMIRYFKTDNFIDLSLTDGKLSRLMKYGNEKTTFYERLEDFKISQHKSDTTTHDLFFISHDYHQGNLLDNFSTLLQVTNTKSCLIMEGIHTSSITESAWAQIKTHESVQVTIDLYFWGLVFFRTEQAKQHFKIRTWKS